MLGLPRRIQMHRPSSQRATEPSSGSAASTEQGDAEMRRKHQRSGHSV